MGKNQSASGLTNIIQYDNNGNVSFVSGSTTLMQISSSGAITTTGVISGSNALSASYALNSGLLNGTGSVGFATTGSLLTVSSSQQQISASQQQLSSSFLILTASFNAVSSSQQQISASYIALSASYNTFSGSASTRITENSSSIQQVSSSQQQISASLLNVIAIGATTGSNSFRATQSITGSLTVTGQIIAQTLNVQQVTSSIIYSSGSNNFGCDLNSRQTFTGSVLITGSLTIAGASSATSYSGATIYGSTVVCSPVGKFTTCLDLGGALTGTSATFSSSTTATQGIFSQPMTNGSTSAFTNPNLALKATISTDTTGFIGMTFATSDAANYGFSYGALRSSGGVGDLVWRNHFNSVQGTEIMRLSNTGITCFACQVCAPQLMVNTSIACGTLNIIGYDNEGINIIDRRTSGSGCFYSSVTFRDYYLGNSGAIQFYHNQYMGGSVNSLRFTVNGSEKLVLTNSSEACFSGNVCAASFNSTSTSYLNGLVVSCNVNSNCFTGITVNNGAGAGSEASRAGIAFQAYDWVQSAIWHGRNTAAAFSGALLFGTNPSTSNLGVGGVCTRLTIDNNGVATFSCAVCAPTLKATGTVIGGNFITDSGTAAIPYNSYATFYTVQNYQNAIYLVTLQLNGYSNYTAFATIIQNDSSLQIANSLSNVAAIQVSGLNIQGTNGSGVTQSMPYKVIRIG